MRTGFLFSLDADPDPTYRLINSIRIRILIEVKLIFDYWSTDPPRLHFERPLPFIASFSSLYSSWFNYVDAYPEIRIPQHGALIFYI
jgi:hypothetical protein